VEVVDGEAHLQSSETEDVNTLVAGQPYPAGTNVTLYVSLVVRFSALPFASGQYFLHFKGNSLSNFRAKVFGFLAQDEPGKIQLGLANSVNSPAATNLAILSLGTDYRVYVRYQLSTATATLWVNPESELSPSVTALDVASSATLTSLALRQDAGIGGLTVDELKLGTTFADVYGPPILVAPGIAVEPVSTAAVVGATASFGVSATGSAPLSYQWQFEGNPIPTATNAVLTLTDLTLDNAGQYQVQVTNVAGQTNSQVATLSVIPPNANGTLSLVQYNLKGNFTSDWSTNAPQVQAIARQLNYLNPDVISVNEIPNGLRYEMTNWMMAFFPDYQLSISAGTDGAIRSGVLSRFPIVRSQSWLENSSLTNFGYAGTFTRDLFEAELAVPGATENLHIFVTHLKSGSDVDSQSRRAAECSAISNFFVTVFLPTNAARPYLLAGDLNEDIQIPMSQNLQPLQRLLSGPAGLTLTTPLNPYTLSRFTHSIQGSMDSRFDYVMPAGVLVENVAVSQVFRTDLLTPLPAGLLETDSVTASDHLPVHLIFNYPDPYLQLTLVVTNESVVLSWPSLMGRQFAVQGSTNLLDWDSLETGMTATNSMSTWTTSAAAGVGFYRVVRLP